MDESFERLCSWGSSTLTILETIRDIFAWMSQIYLTINALDGKILIFSLKHLLNELDITQGQFLKVLFGVKFKVFFQSELPNQV